MMVDRTVLATSLGGIALASVPLMGSTSVAVAACVGVQASDCMLHYGPVAESSYKDTVPKPGEKYFDGQSWTFVLNETPDVQKAVQQMLGRN